MWLSSKRPSAATRRWERKRPRLHELSLTYPNTQELAELASLAKVTDQSIFSDGVRQIILDAHLENEGLRVSAPEVRKILRSIENGARELRSELQSVDVWGKPSADYAGLFLETALDQVTEEAAELPQYMKLLEALSVAAERARLAVKSQRGPKGARGSPAFNSFIEHLLMEALQHQGEGTNYRSADGTWQGSLLKALGSKLINFAAAARRSRFHADLPRT
jgi:hypothetical protein